LFCEPCGRNGVECHRCHRPLTAALVDENGICRACHNKEIHPREEALGRAACIVSIPPSTDIDPLKALIEARNEVEQELQDKLSELFGVKWLIVLVIRMKKTNMENEEVFMVANFCSHATTLITEDEFNDQYEQHIVDIMCVFSEYTKDGSGWTVDAILNFDLYMAEYSPTSPSSYIKSPKFIADKKAVVNVKNNDDKCFIWAIISALHPANFNIDRPNNYTPFEAELNVTGLVFPLAVKDVKMFEKLNPWLIVNVFAYDDKTKIYPVYLSKTREGDPINLLILNENGRCHYTWIKSMSRLLFVRGQQKTCQKYYCYFCMHGFCSEENLKLHVEDCRKFGMNPIKLPDPDNEEECWVKFKSVQKCLPVPFIIYADFESYTTKIEGPTKSKEKSYTHSYELHEPSGFAYLVVSSDPNRKFSPVLYRGPDVVKEFISRLQMESEKIIEVLSHPVPIIISQSQEEAFQKTELCALCDQPLGADRVRDHCHLTGAYRFAIHSSCNLAYSFRGSRRSGQSFFIPVVFHNLRGYDEHLILSGIKNEHFNKQPNITCIPNNTERYLSFSINNLCFIDSLQFLNSSLEKLVSNLPREDFIHTRAFWPADKVDLLLRKGVYPYDYMDAPEKMLERQLPPREAFFSELTENDISDEDYAHAQRVWTEFEMTDLGQYHDTYLVSDVLLLADVFENFRLMCLKFYGLDAAHYYTSPGLAWDSMLKFTKVELQLLTDREMHDIVDKGTRGGVCCISHKHSVANNEYIPESFDPANPSSFIMYLDMNNLYGTAMVEALPEKEFDFLLAEQVDTFDFMSVPDDAPEGYILEVDIQYPDNLHDVHSDYPLCPEANFIDPSDLSPYTISLANKLKYKPSRCQKLVCNLRNKQRYAVHYRNLKLYVRLGMVVTKIHRVISFTQSRWLKPYIDFNTEQRKAAKNPFLVDLFKLFNNSVFGKTMQNVRKQKDVRLAMDGRQFRRLVAKPNFDSFKIFSDDLTGVNMSKIEVYLNKPSYVGMAILDISKTFMFEFHYDKILKKYGDKAKLLMTDTDSLVYHITTPDIYRDMIDDLDSYDTSDYPPTHPAYSVTNKKKLGKMKDELASKPIKEFVGLRAKMYSILDYDGLEKKRAKGINKCTTDKYLRHASYRYALLHEQSSKVTMQTIRSLSHRLYTVQLYKTGLSPYDDKRYVLDDKVTTLAHGHYRNRLT